MSVDAEGLVIQPFQELAETARLAVANAEAVLAEDAASQPAERMLKAARGLVKEGDRALQRIQPLWTAQADKYGDAFRDAIRDHGRIDQPVRRFWWDSGQVHRADVPAEGISESRRVLDDLLYDLDDYIELDTFDPERYGEIQVASKTFALNAIETIKRLKLETPTPPPHAPLPPPGSPLVTGYVFPPLPPLPPGKSLAAQRPATSGGRHPDDVRQPKLKPRPVSHLESMRNGSNLSNENSNQLHRTETKRSQASSIHSCESHGSSTVSHRLSGQWPLKPSPLQLGQTSSTDDRGLLSPVSPETDDRPVAQFAADSPNSASPVDNPSVATQSNTSIPRTSEWVTDQVSSRRHHRSSRTDTIPEDDVIAHTVVNDGDAPDGGGGERSNRNTMASAYRNSYVFEVPASPTSTSYRTSVLSDTSENNHRVSGIKLVGRASEEASPSVPPLPGHHGGAPPSPSIDIPPRNPSRLTHRRGDSLLTHVVIDARAQSAGIPREEKEPAPEPWYSLQPACSIGDDSSVRRLGPLCNGALRFREGGGQTATMAGLVQVGLLCMEYAPETVTELQFRAWA